MSFASDSNQRSDKRKAVIASALIALVFIALVTALLWAGDAETEAADPPGLAVFFAYQHIALLVIVGLMAVFAPQLWLVRKRAVEAAGPLLLRVKRPRFHKWKYVGYVLWAIILCVTAILLLISPFSIADLGRAVAYTTPFALMATLELLGISRSFLEIRQRGIVYFTLFWPWDRIRAYTWTHGGSTLKLRISGHGFVGFNQFGLDPAMKDELGRILEEHRQEPQPVG